MVASELVDKFEDKDKEVMPKIFLTDTSEIYGLGGKESHQKFQ